MRRIWKQRARIHLLVAAAVVACLALVGAGEAGAATITVNCTADPSALASALLTANSGDTLSITGTCTGTFDIQKSLTLAGAGGGKLTARVPSVLDGQGAGPVVTVDAGQTVDIRNLTIKGGNSTASTAVGGVHNFGTLTLTHSSVNGNSASSSSASLSFAYGGIFNDVGGTLTLTQSPVSGNSASASPGFAFGGIFNGGTMTITSSSVSGNNATATAGPPDSSGVRVARAGIENGGTMTITGSSVSGNTASAPSNASGGILNTPTNTLKLSNSSVSGNSASADGGTVGGIGNNGGQVTLSNSPVCGNSASSVNGPAVGGISNKNSIPPSTPGTGNVTITNGTVCGNSASAPTGTIAGGTSNEAPATITLTNSTVVNNIPCDVGTPFCA